MLSADKKLLDKFFSNSCDYIEAEKISSFLERNPEELDKIDVFGRIDDQEIITTSYEDKERLADRILGKRPATVRMIQRIAVAASLIFLVAGLWFWMSKNNVSRPDKHLEIVAENDIKNNTNTTMNYILPDSSELVLLPGAFVMYKSDFRNNRNIKIDKGDVFFKVKKDENHPFMVIANGVKTTALGTQFWVRNFTVNESLIISLVEGKIMINSVDERFSMDSVYLKPGQVCYINKASGKINISSDDVKRSSKTKSMMVKEDVTADAPKNEIVWTNENMKFSNATLGNVFSKLENRYNVTIIAADPEMLKASMTGTIFYSDSLEMIIKTICELNKLSYETKNDSIFLRRK